MLLYSTNIKDSPNVEIGPRLQEKDDNEEIIIIDNKRTVASLDSLIFSIHERFFCVVYTAEIISQFHRKPLQLHVL